MAGWTDLRASWCLAPAKNLASNKLHVDLQQPHALVTTKWAGPLTTKRFDWSAPWSSGMAGLSLFTQGAFVQVRSGALALTYGVKLKLPTTFQFMNKAVFQANNQQVIGPQTFGYARPYLRYRIK